MNETKAIKKIVEFLCANPVKALLIGILVSAGILFGATKLHTNFSYRIWFKEDNPKLKVFDAFERRFGSDELAVVVLHSPSGILDKESSEALIQLTEDMWQAPEVIRVDSLANFNWVHADGDEILVEPFLPDDANLTEEYLKQRQEIAHDHKTINGYLISKDQKTALIFANLKPSINSTPDYDLVVNGMRKIISKYEGKSDHQLFLTGTPALNFAFKESSEMDMKRLMPIVLLMVIIFLVATFKRVSGILVPLTMITITVLATLGMAGWIGLELNNLTSVVPQFMIAISVAVIVHLLVNFYRFYSTGLAKDTALEMALVKNFRPTLLTSLSTAIGFFSFSTSGIPPIADMGIMAGFGTLLSWALTYLFVSPLLLLFPIRMKTKKDAPSIKDASPFSIKMTEQIYKIRKPLIALSLISAMIMFALALKTEVNSDPFNYFNEKYPLTIANNFVEEHVGGAVAAEIIIDSGVKDGIKDPEFLNKVEAFQNWVSTIPHVTKTVSIINILKEMNQTLNGGSQEQYTLAQSKNLIAQQLFLYTMNLPQGMDINNRMTIENDAIRLSALWTVHDSKTALGLIDQMEQKAKEMGLNAQITGKMPLYQSNNEIVVQSFIVSLSIALILVAILLCFGLRSVRIGLISILPNALPLIFGGGILFLMGKSLDIGTVIVCSICLGIAVDDTIHFLANFKLYKDEGYSSKEAVAKIFTHTAPALITTTTVLVAAFATFSFASFVPNQNFGEMVSIILTIALIADLTFLPAFLLTFDIFKNDHKSQ